MCQISEHLKLCTCQTNSDNNYWIINRKKMGQLKVGQMIYLPNTLNIKENEIIKLLDILNKNLLFDFEYTPLEEDKLEMHFQINEKSSEYNFIFSNGLWHIYTGVGSCEIMDLLENKPLYSDVYKGVIKTPFSNH